MSINELKFVNAFMKTGNKAKAYKAAYPDASDASARSTSIVKAAQPNVARAIAIRMEAAAKRLDVTAERVTAELARIAFLDPRKFFYPDGALKHITELDDEEAAAISSFDVEESRKVSKQDDDPTYVKKVRVWPKLDALRILAQVTKVIADDGATKEPAKSVVAPADVPLDTWLSQQKTTGKPN